MQTSTTGRKQNRAARLDRAKNRAKEPVQINLEWDEEEKRAAVDFLNNILANTDLSDNVHLPLNALYDKLRNDSSRRSRWKFKMINPDRFLKVQRNILSGDEPFVTLKVWNVATCHVEHNTGRVSLSRQQIADEALTSAKAVSSAMVRLEKAGAIQRRPDGRGVTYWIDPRIGWAGDYSQRQLATADYLEQAEELIRKARTEPELRAVN